jgi:hypothetical protein
MQMTPLSTQTATSSGGRIRSVFFRWRLRLRGAIICAHVFAVLGARKGGIETDWYFGVGPRGLAAGRGSLIAYYIYSAFV